MFIVQKKNRANYFQKNINVMQKVVAVYEIDVKLTHII